MSEVEFKPPGGKGPPRWRLALAKRLRLGGVLLCVGFVSILLWVASLLWRHHYQEKVLFPRLLQEMADRACQAAASGHGGHAGGVIVDVHADFAPDGWVDEEGHVADPWGSRIVLMYKSNASRSWSVSARSAGPDQELYTSDDLVRSSTCGAR